VRGEPDAADIVEAYLYQEGPAAAPRGWKGRKGKTAQLSIQV
jgi:hypothetical protein